MASQPPFAGPCFLTASIAYAEQLGEYLHEAIVKGEMAYW
jgi:hypothetical protein